MPRPVALRFRSRSWGTPQSPPTSFLLFAYGRNDTTKGPVYLSRAGAEKCVARWKARKIELAADYEHAALDPGTKGAPAAAWFDLAVGEDGLYAVNVRWAESAKQYFLRGEYRYHSPFVDLEADAQGKQWVVALHNFALTNWPATDRQRPLVARAFTAAGRRFTMLDPAKLKEVLEALEKTSLAPEEVSALISACTGGGMAAPEPPAEEPMAAEPEEEEEGLPYSAPAVDVVAQDAAAPTLAASLKAALGLAPTATDAAALALAATHAKQGASMAQRLAALEADKKKRDGEERAALFSAFKQEGRLRFAKEAEARALLERHGAEAFRAAYGNVPALEQPAPAQVAPLPTTGVGGAIESAKSGAAFSITADQVRAFAKEKGIDASNPAGFKAAASAYYKQHARN